MASFYTKIRTTSYQYTSSPIVDRLRGIFRCLDDAQLITALKGHRHRGCQGYTVRSLWYSYVMSYVLNMPSVAALVRTLQNNPLLCRVCGINPCAVPHQSTYSRFIAKLSTLNSLVLRTLKRVVAILKDYLEDFGRIVAIDSTDLTACSSSDPDAQWSAKHKKGRRYYWFGYKVHIVVDVQTELPIHLEVTPAKVSDYRSFIGPIQRAGIIPSHILADAGYDSKANYSFVVDELEAIPIIQLNPRGKRISGRIPRRSRSELRLLRLRDNPGIDRSSSQWRYLYNQRTSVERLISRMKECRQLRSVRHRGLAKVTLHCYLSSLSILASALWAIHSGQPMRRVA